MICHVHISHKHIMQTDNNIQCRTFPMESVKILDYPFIILLEALIDAGWKIIANQAEDEPEDAGGTR